MENIDHEFSVGNEITTHGKTQPPDIPMSRDKGGAGKDLNDKLTAENAVRNTDNWFGAGLQRPILVVKSSY